MLVLARKRDQVVRIGDDISVMVVDIRGSKVRLGIHAPQHLSIHRKEIYDRIHRLGLPDLHNVQKPAAANGGMLVLSRARDQSILIGDDVCVTVVDIRGDKVRLGFDAPREISVHRQEVYEAVLRERQGCKPELNVPA